MTNFTVPGQSGLNLGGEALASLAHLPHALPRTVIFSRTILVVPLVLGNSLGGPGWELV